MLIDKDLMEMTQGELRLEAQKLRDAIRKHRDSSGHDLCWYHPELWGVLPEKVEPKPFVPDWEEFIQNCAAYRKSLEDPR
jgi:hypothetical protein